MQIKKYCHFCGNRLGERFVEGRTRKYCYGCDQPIYENPVPAACVVLIDDKERVLLTKRNVEPKAGYWCLPGGYIELGESSEEAALRELEEEAGLKGRIEMLMGVSTDPNPHYDTVLIAGYLVKDFSGIPVAGDDVSEADFFMFDNLPEIAFDSHKMFIRNYYSAYSSLPFEKN